MHTRSLFAVAVVAVGLFVSITAGASIITVAQDGSGDYLTIQEGIDAASAGDTVSVMPGYYNTAGEREINGEMRRANVFLKSGVDLQGAGPEGVIIAANSKVVSIEACILAVDVDDALLGGFTITGHIEWEEPHYQYYGSGLIAENSTLTVAGNIFDSYIVHPTNPQQSGCQFFGCMTIFSEGSSALVVNNVFLYGDDVYLPVTDSEALIYNNTFYGWDEEVEAEAVGGMRSTLDVRNNTFAFMGNAIALYSPYGGDGSILSLSHNNYWGVDNDLVNYDEENQINDYGSHTYQDPLHTLVNLRYGQYDFSLSAGSPLIDAGNNTSVPGAITTDLAGNNRFIDDPDTTDTGVGTPPIVDKGAYEYAPQPSATPTVTPAPTETPTPIPTATPTATPTPTITPTPTPLIPTQSFEGTFPPSGWTQSGCDKSSICAHTGTYSVRFNANGDYLITPLLTTPGVLTYWMRAASGTTSFSVQYASSASGPWTHLAGSPTTTNYNNSFKKHTFNLSGYSNIYILYKRNNSKTYYLDDVNVTCR